MIDIKTKIHPYHDGPPKMVCAYQLTERQQVTRDILRLFLRPSPGVTPFGYKAGQYCCLQIADESPRDYSIANMPDGHQLEFHIRNMGSGASAAVAQMKIGDPAQIAGPFGHAYFRSDHDGPMLAVAGGSGLAPVKAVCETALTRNPNRKITLLHGVRDEDNLYLSDYFYDLAEKHAHFAYLPVLSEPKTRSDFTTGLVGDIAVRTLQEQLQDKKYCDDIADIKAYMAGPPVMVKHCANQLLQAGFHVDNIHSDASYGDKEQRERLKSS